MKTLDKYIDDLQFFEELSQLSENSEMFSSKEMMKKIVDKMAGAAKNDDIKKLQKIAKLIPRVTEDKLYNLGKKAHPKFEATYKYAEKDISNILMIKDIKQKKIMSCIVAAMACVSNDPKTKSRKLVEAIKTRRDAKQKKFGAAVGFLGLLVAGAFLSGAFSTLALFPLLLALVITGISLMVIMGATA